MNIDRKGQDMKTIAIDLDGVLAEYAEWKGHGVIGNPYPWAIELLAGVIRQGFAVAINTTRGTGETWEWLKRHKLDSLVRSVNMSVVPELMGNHSGKPVADIYLDDRAVVFDGNIKATLLRIKSFTPWQEDQPHE